MKVLYLMVGDYLHGYKFKHLVKVTADHIKAISEGDKDYTPIVLTAELVSRIPGFKDMFFNDEEKRAINWSNGTLFVGGFDASAIYQCFPFPCLYFHTLQQIIRLATGKEIEYPA